jgi:aryl-alcohol dehydrogenase-like predicted oxidoreductase
MQYNRLGQSGLVTSRLCFGTMTFTHTPGEGRMPAVAKVRQKEADDIVAACLGNGVNFFNSADVYANGEGEEMLAAALGKRRHEAIISTKVGGRIGGAPLLCAGLSRRHLVMAVEESLRRLKTDWIDLYLFHKADPHTPVDETLDAMEQLVRDGKIRYTGLSNWQPWKLAKAAQYQKDHGYQRFVAAEYYYSLLGREIENDLIPAALDASISLLAWGPLASGFLSGKYSGSDPNGGGGRRANFAFPPFDPAKGDEVISALRAIGEPMGASCAQVALAWLLAKPVVGSVIMSGTSIAQVLDNIGAAEVRLSAEDVARLDALTPPARPLLDVVIENGGDHVMKATLYPK